MELARARKRDVPEEIVHLPGLNHLLVKATTGEVSEYGSLPERKISPEVASTLGSWIKTQQGVKGKWYPFLSERQVQ